MKTKRTGQPFATQALTVYQQQSFRLVQIESICRQQNKCDRNIEISFGKGRKYCEERRKFWLPVFSTFPTMFIKVFLNRVVKSLVEFGLLGIVKKPLKDK